MPRYETIEVACTDSGIATVTLNRPEVRNAMNPTLIGEVTAAVAALGGDDAVRAIVIGGAGKVFCAGADLNWMRDVGDQSEKEVAGDSRNLQKMYRTIATCRKPTIARVHGAAMAGGLGIVACCDIAIAESAAKFCVSEVRLGLVPGIISVFLLPRIGPSWLRYLSVSAVTFDAAVAQRAGLVHELAADEAALDDRVSACADLLLAASPDAIAMCKDLLADVGAAPRDDLAEAALGWNVRARKSPAAQEGMTAFLERRAPQWAAG